jgi:hypothetical protein
VIVTLQEVDGRLVVIIPEEYVRNWNLKVGDIIEFNDAKTAYGRFIPTSEQLDLVDAPHPSPAAPSPLSPEQARISVGVVKLHDFANKTLQVDRRLTKKRAGILKARLAEGFTLEQLKQVVTWVSANAFLRGSNSRNRAYDDYTNMFRSAERVEEYLRYANGTAGTDKLLPGDDEPTFRVI